ncbi:MAG TPA: CRISPR-associated protein Csx19 [bacterium]|nr:CRISPR-associated protein Csx19 [bacterium]
MDNEIGCIKKIKSIVELPDDKIDILNNIENFIKNNISDGYIVVWLNYAIFIGKIEKNFIFHNGKTPDFSHLLQLRAFNKDKEIFIWRSSSNTYKCRIRIDNEGENTEVIDAQQVIWGTKSKNLQDGFSEIYEDRGIKLIVPFNNLKLNNNRRLMLKTRNYIRHNEIGQAGFFDSRFVDIYPINK